MRDDVARDNNGSVTSVTQANGVTTDCAYDELDRLTSTTAHPQNGTNLVTSYALDPRSRPARWTTLFGFLE